MQRTRDSIRDRGVCVVGGAGFLGSQLVDHLVEDRGCRVLVVDNLCVGRREWVHPRARFLHHDITGSEEFLRRSLRGSSPVGDRPEFDYVFNYAAYPYIPDSFARPIRVSDVNFFGAMKVINAAKEAGCRAILQVSSAEIYGEGTRHSTSELERYRSDKIDELDDVVPHSTYGVSKAAIDSWISVRWREARTPCIAMRQFNCIGPRGTHPYVLPEIISQLSRQRENWCRTDIGDGTTSHDTRPRQPPVHGIVRLGNDSYRDFQFSGDAVRMAVELLEGGEFGEVYNLGSEEGTTIYGLAEVVARVMGFHSVEVIKDEARVRPWEIWHLKSDNSKVYRVIEYRPTKNLAQSVKTTVDWFNNNGRRWPWEAKS